MFLKAIDTVNKIIAKFLVGSARIQCYLWKYLNVLCPPPGITVFHWYSQGICFLMGQKEGVFVGAKALRLWEDTGDSKAWEMGCRQSWENNYKIQEKLLKFELQTELLSPGETPWHRIREEAIDHISMENSASLWYPGGYRFGEREAPVPGGGSCDGWFSWWCICSEIWGQCFTDNGMMERQTKANLDNMMP